MIEPRKGRHKWDIPLSILPTTWFSAQKGELLLSTMNFLRSFTPISAGIARGLGGKTLIVNGVADHVHLLVQLPATISVAEFVRDIKANSSKWMHEQMGIPRSKFSWQTGYGCFSESKSNLSNAQKYIAKQEEHHRKVSFQEEFLLFLKQHEIDYDEKYIWE